MIKTAFVAVGLVAMAQIACAQSMGGQNQPRNQWVMNCNVEKGRDCTVSAMVDGNSLLGTFLIVSYSAAYNTLAVVVDGVGQRASMQVDWHPFVSTDICTGGICSFVQGKSDALVQQMLAGKRIAVQVSMQDDSMTGPLTMTLSGFDAQYKRAVQAQQRR